MEIPQSVYQLIWKFKVKVGLEEEFARSYGSDGPWASLFRKAAGYVGTELLCDTTDARNYVTIDKWTSEQAFEGFKANSQAEYDALDKQSEHLTDSEESIGRFVPVATA